VGLRWCLFQFQWTWHASLACQPSSSVRTWETNINDMTSSKTQPNHWRLPNSILLGMCVCLSVCLSVCLQTWWDCLKRIGAVLIYYVEDSLVQEKWHIGISLLLLHLFWSSILYQLPPSTTVHSILPVQFTYLTFFTWQSFLHNLSSSPFWSTSLSGPIHFILHTFFTQSFSFLSQHMPVSSQHVLL